MQYYIIKTTRSHTCTTNNSGLENKQICIEKFTLERFSRSTERVDKSVELVNKPTPRPIRSERSGKSNNLPKGLKRPRQWPPSQKNVVRDPRLSKPLEDGTRRDKSGQIIPCKRCGSEAHWGSECPGKTKAYDPRANPDRRPLTEAYLKELGQN